MELTRRATWRAALARERTPDRTPCRRIGRVAALAVLLACVGCERFPRDPEGTLERVQGGELRVGASHHPPWVALERGRPPTGREAALAEALAASVQARVRWQPGGLEDLLERLHRHELDLVIGGLTADTPWNGRVALSAPHATMRRNGRQVRHVLALPPGENAWQLHVDRTLRSRAGAQP